MSTSSREFDSSTIERALGESGLEAASRLVEEAAGGKYTFEHLLELSSLDPEPLAWLLGSLGESGVVHPYWVVESPTHHGAIKKYDRLADVPAEVHDWRNDVFITVGPENIRVMYRFEPAR